MSCLQHAILLQQVCCVRPLPSPCLQTLDMELLPDREREQKRKNGVFTGSPGLPVGP